MTGYSYFAHHQDPRFEVCITGDQLQKLSNVLEEASVYAKDYETDGTAWWRGDRPCGVAFSSRPRPGEPIQSFYVPYRHRTGQVQAHPDKVVELCKRFDEDPGKTKVMHNRKFDDHMGRVEGIRLAGLVIDTMLEARLYHEDVPAGLKHRAVVDLQDPDAQLHEQMLNLDIIRLAAQAGMNKTDYLSAFGYSTIDVYMAGRYAAHDTELTLRLREFYEQASVRSYYGSSPRGSQYWGIWHVEMALAEVLTDMEETGVPVDVDHIMQMYAHLEQEKAQAEFRFFKESGLEWFKLGSDDELRDRLLYMGCPLTKETKKGKLAVDSDVLQECMVLRPELKWVQRWRDTDKLASTYTQSLLQYVDEYGVLHGNFQQMGTNTGRLSCRSPNLQNIPTGALEKFLREVLGFEDQHVQRCLQMENVKRVFMVQRPADHPLFQEWFGYSGQGTSFRLFCDYSQIELRVIAHYTQDPRLLKTYWENGDIHDETERAVFGTGTYVSEQGEKKSGPNRRYAKVLNFGQAFCLSPQGMVRHFPSMSIEEAEGYFAQFNQNFARISAFRHEFWGFVLTNGCVFNNMFGRTRHLPGIASADRQTRERSKRQAIATLVQGTAAELTKQSLVFISLWLKSQGLKSRITQTVHDEIQVDGPAEEFAVVARGVKAIMEDFPDFSVPVVTDAEYSVTYWSEKSSLNLE